MLTNAQAERLRACARVLKAPARVVLTGDVAPGAAQALSADAAPGVEVIELGPDEIARLDGPIDVLFIGPARRFSLAVDSFERWPNRVVPGGTLFIHGAFARPALTAALLRTVGASRAWRYFGREGALAEYFRADLSHGEHVLDAIAQVAQLPWFARQLVRRRIRARRDI